MSKFAVLDFDDSDTQDQYAIVYNAFADGSGDSLIEWFDTEEQRAIQVEKDVSTGVSFLAGWESRA